MLDSLEMPRKQRSLPHFAKISLVSIACLAGGYFAFQQAMSSTLANKMPDYALMSSFDNGFATLRKAEQLFAMDNMPKKADEEKSNAEQGNAQAQTPQILTANLKISDEVKALSRLAFQQEGSAAGALRLLALSEQAKMPQTAQKLMENTVNVSRHDEPAVLWLMQHYAQANDVKGSLRMFDIVAHTRPIYTAQIMPFLVDVLKNNAMVDDYYAVLKEKPIWEDLFWKELNLHPESLVNGSQLRMRIAKDRKLQFNKEDREITSALVASKNFDQAILFYQNRNPSNGQPGTQSLIRNSDFSKPSVAPPLDWQVISSANYGAALFPKQKSLEISAVPNISGVVARQLVKLPKGVYQIRAKYHDDTAMDPVPLRVKIRCAENNQENIFFDIDARNYSKAFEQDINCSYFMIELAVNPMPSISEGVFFLDSLDIRPYNKAGN